MKKTLVTALLLASVSATAFAQAPARPATPAPAPAAPAAAAPAPAPAAQAQITIPNPVPAIKAEAADAKAKAEGMIQDMKGRSYVFSGEQVLTVGVGAVAGYFIGSWIIGGTILPAVTTVAGAYLANHYYLTK